MRAPDCGWLIKQALKEDLDGLGDLTTRFFVPRGARLKGKVVARSGGVICGTTVAREVVALCDRAPKVSVLVPDGKRARPMQTVMTLEGGPGLLTAERTALNFLQRLSGVATLTASYVEKVKGTRAKVYDTRKTIPGWRELDKYAVRCGGGTNHRMGLYDAVMLKDNHWAAGGDVEGGVRNLRRKHPKVILEIEADTLAQAERALQLGADVILLDNMTFAQLKVAIKMIRRARPETEIEISGGVSLETIGGLARLGPDRISVGKLTHSAAALDLALDLEFA